MMNAANALTSSAWSSEANSHRPSPSPTAEGSASPRSARQSTWRNSCTDCPSEATMPSVVITGITTVIGMTRARSGIATTPAPKPVAPRSV